MNIFREMKMAWKAVEQARKEFDDTEYLIDDIWNRREAREHLFELVDHATEVSFFFFNDLFSFFEFVVMIIMIIMIIIIIMIMMNGC